jgi:hypothetical protein
MSRAVARRLDRLEGRMGGIEGQVFVVFPRGDQNVDDAVREQGLTLGPDDSVIAVVFVAPDHREAA